MDPHRSFDCFGPFTLDRARRRLTRDGQRILLPGHHMRVLLALTREPGEFVDKEALLAAGWPHAVSDDNLYKAVKALRALFDPHASGRVAIRMHRGKGYCFSLPRQVLGRSAGVTTGVTALDHAAESTAIEALLEPGDGVQPAVRRGRRALEQFDRDGVRAALDTFASALAEAEDDDLAVTAHAGMAAALWLQFEATRADDVPDDDALRTAQQHVLAAARRNPRSARATAALALVRHRRGLLVDAIHAARQAVGLAPKDWRFHLVLAFVSGGAERLEAAEAALALTPHNPFAHWLAATVYISRQAFTPALEHIAAGCQVQDQQRTWAGAAGFPVVGLYLLLGLVRCAQGDRDGARVAWQRELSFATDRHVYGREAAANAWHALGALAMRDGDRTTAMAAFAAALAQVPGHAVARLALHHLAGGPMPETDARHHDPLRATLVRATGCALAGQPDAAAALLTEALLASPVPVPPGTWSLPVDPLLQLWEHPQASATLLSLLRTRAL